MAVIDSILEELVKRGGTDVHLAVNQPPLGRIGGEIVPLREGAIAGKALEEMAAAGAFTLIDLEGYRPGRFSARTGRPRTGRCARA